MVKGTTNADVFRLLENWAPKSLAEEWDNVGLQVGSYHKPVKRIMVTLDVLEAVVDEAIANEVDLIIAHHPILFKPLQQLNLDSWRGRVVKKLIQHDITVYAAHTNLDIANGGVNDMLADLLGLTNREIMVDTNEEALYKIAVYVPEAHIEEVMDAVTEAGAGHIGKYSHCTFRTTGTGTFKPLIGTSPFIGEQDKLENVTEVKLETVVQETRLQKVLKAILGAHPYEEVAYDVIPLQNTGEKYGLGRVGTLANTVTLEELTNMVKTTLEVSTVRVSGNLTKKIKRVAVLGGSGEKYIIPALHKKADVYITGDMTFHHAQEAIEMGLAIIDAGHYIEKVMKLGTKQFLEAKIKNGHEIDPTIDVIVSTTNTDPFQYK